MNIIDSTAGKGCTLNAYDNGIYEFTFTAATRETINAWVELLIDLYKGFGFRTRFLPLLLDTSNVGALTHTTKRAAHIVPARPQHPQHLVTATAVIATQTTLNDIVRPMINGLMRMQQLRDVVKFFEPDEREDAIRWLLREKLITK